MRFLIDAQLPPALARWLVGKGHEAAHVADCGLAEANDREIWRYAPSVGAVILIKDEDFSIRKILDPAGPVIVCPAWEQPSRGVATMVRGDVAGHDIGG